MTDILDRLSTANGPDRELDAEVWLADDSSNEYRFLHPHLAPNYTGSIDSALTLIPKTLIAIVGITIGVGHAVVSARTGSILNPKTIEFEGGAVTAACAICIAALKATAFAREETQ